MLQMVKAYYENVDQQQKKLQNNMIKIDTLKK